MRPAATKILLYPCNLVGYGRLSLLAISVAVVALYSYVGWPITIMLRWGIATLLFISLLILDVVDGYLARKLGHATKFGAVFEQTIDLLTHTFVWTLSGLALAPFIIALEWTAGLFAAAFTLQPQQHWKAALVEDGPWLVRVYFRPMRLNLLNVYSNIAHFALPLSLFVGGSASLATYLMLPGLLIFEIVTLGMIYTFAKLLLAENMGD